MHRAAAIILGAMLLIGGVCQGQSLADAARENRKQKAVSGSGTTKVITGDDFSGAAETTIKLVPGATSSGDGTLAAPGFGKHNYAITYLDATRFTSGGVIHITITVGSGAAEASFDLYSEGARLPSDGLPNSLASAHSIHSGATAKIDYRFDHPGVFRLGAEGSWNAKLGDTNTYSFTVDVASR